MDQFAQLRDRVKDFEKRQAQLLFVFPKEAAYDRQWLRARKVAPGEPTCPLLADPSFTVSATYGVAFQPFRWEADWPTTFIIDRDGVLRFEAFAKGANADDRPSVEELLQVLDGPGKTQPKGK
jgi:peroxiredoxin